METPVSYNTQQTGGSFDNPLLSKTDALFKEDAIRQKVALQEFRGEVFFPR
jgi:hypothetical protein